MGHMFKNCLLSIFLATIFTVLPPGSLWGLTLDACIDAALKMNPGIEAASHRVKASRAAHSQAGSTWYPQITASGSHTRTDNPSQAFMMSLNQKRLDMASPGFDPLDPGTTFNTNVSLAIQYLLFDGGRTRVNQQITEHQAEISGYVLAALKNELVYQVTRGYYNVLKARDFINVFQDTTASIEKSLQLAQDRFDEGVAVKTDVLNLEVQLAQAQEDLIEAENRLLLAIAVLNTSIGAEIVSSGDLIHPQRDAAAPLKPEIKATVKQRPELQAAALLTQSRKLGLRSARRDYLPNVTAFASMDMDSRSADNFEESYIAGINAQWEIFTGFRRSEGISEARSLRNEAVALLKETRKHLELDLKEAGIRVKNASQRLNVTLKGIDSAEESLRITRNQYQNGAVEITALLNAQVAMTSSSARNRAAHYDYMEALANIDRAAGKR